VAEGARPATDSGVIHDIGYRHYDGERLGRAAIRRALFTESLRGAYGLGRAAKTKVVPMLLLAAMCLPALVSVVVVAVAGGESLPIRYVDYAFDLQLLVAVYLAAQAPVSVSRDLRFGVMALYLSRPMERVDYVVAKAAALATAVLVLLALPLLVMFAGALLNELPLGEQVPDLLRALASVALLSVVLAGIGLVIASVTPRRGLGVAAIIAVLVVLSGVQEVGEAIATEEGQRDAAGWTGLVSPFTLVQGVAVRLLGIDAQGEVGPPGTLGTLVFCLVTALVLLSCAAALVLRYRRVSIA
jgi:ABC-2 type transport system permease protein